jgi:MFS superfamily sulfate permease-like transporter
LHGVWLLAAVAAAPWLLRAIPTAALAAILVYTGYKLVSLEKIRMLARAGRSEVLIYLATVIGIVATDLLTGVAIGFALALLKLLYTFSHLEVKLERAGDRVDIYLNGAATFLRLPKLAAAIESVPIDTELHLHLERLEYIDHACMDLIAGAKALREKAGSSLVVEYEQLEQRLYRLGATATARAAA